MTANGDGDRDGLTVSELIERLQELDGDKAVLIEYGLPGLVTAAEEDQRRFYAVEGVTDIKVVKRPSLFAPWHEFLHGQATLEDAVLLT